MDGEKLRKEAGPLNKAVFLDRDGVLIEDVGYPYQPQHLRLKQDILPHLRLLQDRGFLLIVVTNQSGIARGLFSIDQYRDFQALVEKKLREEGVNISATYFCPFHPEGSIPRFSCEHEDRKPGSGMILKAASDFNIDFDESFMIGDKDSDRINLDGFRSFIIRGTYSYRPENRIYDSYEVLLKDAGVQ